MNHIHTDLTGSQESDIAKGEHVASELRSALSEAYPDRQFTISYTPDEVTYWQTTPDSPHEGRVWRDEARAEAWCTACRCSRPFHRTDHHDSRLVEGEWGTCDECGAEVLIQCREKLIFVAPGSDPQVQ